MSNVGAVRVGGAPPPLRKLGAQIAPEITAMIETGVKHPGKWASKTVDDRAAAIRLRSRVKYGVRVCGTGMAVQTRIAVDEDGCTKLWYRIMLPKAATKGKGKG